MERYKQKRTNGRFRREHIVVWESAHGPIPDGYVIHHKNGNGLDNRLENLEMMTNSEHIALHHSLRRKGEDPVNSVDARVVRDRERQRIAHAKYRETHKEQIRAYYQSHRDEAIRRVRAYAEANREMIASKKKVYASEHKEEIAKYQKAYREKYHAKRLKDEKMYRESHKAEIALGKKICYAVNKGRPQEEIDRMRSELKAMRELRKRNKV